MSELAAQGPADEALYQQTMQELRLPQKAPATSMLFVVLMLVFVAGAFGQLKSVASVVVLVAVVTVHEAGHALGMRLFGFRDVQMFFIPFFGAAVTGRPRGASAWKEATVTLLGPLPGILAGLALVMYATAQRHPVALQFHVAEVLLLLNGFNLLPLGFLDGGRFLERVLFSRHRVLEIAFQVAGSLLLGFFAVQGSMYLLGIFAFLSLVSLPLRWRTLSAAASLREQLSVLAADPAELAEPEARSVFAAARAAVRHPASERPADVARMMEAVLQAMKPAPGALGTLGLLLLYGFGLACVLVGTALLFGQIGAMKWQTVQRPGWRAEFPREPMESPLRAIPGQPAHTEWRAVIDGAERFTVTVTDSGEGEAWMNRAGDRLAEGTATKLASAKPIEIAGRPALEFELSAPGRIVRARMATSGARHIQAIASAPAWGENQRRFLESFTLADSLAR